MYDGDGRKDVSLGERRCKITPYLDLMDSGEWIWPFSAHERAHGHERARWWACACVTCCFWFKGTHLVGLMPDHQPLFFIFSVDLPLFSRHSFLSPCQLSFSLFLGFRQHVALSGSHGVRLNTLMSLPSCVSLFSDPEPPNEWDETHILQRLGSFEQCW